MRNKLFTLLFSTLIIIIILSSCGTRQQEQQASNDPFIEFMQFYNKFLQDSTFQMGRVLFPLEGMPSNADSALIAAKNFRGQKEDWIMHRPFEFEGSDFEQQFMPFDDDLIVESIVHKSGYASERRFAKIEDKWYLIYYSGLNQLK